MDTKEPKPTIRRPVVQVQSTGQMTLFGGPRPSQDEHRESQTVPTLKFVDPDPEALAFGDSSLRSYLKSADLESAFTMRNLFEGLDWSTFEARYKPGGRPPYSPRRMVSLIIYGVSQGISSLRALEQMARRDLVALWLSGGICPDHSKIGRFINLHQAELTTEFFESMAQAILEKLVVVNFEVAGDGSVIEAAANRFRRLKKEALEEWVNQAEEALKNDPDDAKKKQKNAEHAHECLAACKARIKARERARSATAQDAGVNPSDPDAIIHKFKRGTFGYAYVPSLMVNRHRLILSQTVHTSSETAIVASALDQVERVLGGAPTALCLDSNYFCSSVLDEANRRDLNLLCPAPEQTRRSKKKKKPKTFPKHQFIYDPDTDTYQCPANQQLQASFDGYNKERGEAYKSYHTQACTNCPLRDQCTSAVRGRRIKRYESDEMFDAMRTVMKQPQAQQAYGHRQGSVEPVFGELRHIQGLERFRRTRLAGVQVEFALHSMAHNLRRLLVAAARSGSQRTSNKMLSHLDFQPFLDALNALWNHPSSSRRIDVFSCPQR